MQICNSSSFRITPSHPNRLQIRKLSGFCVVRKRLEEMSCCIIGCSNRGLQARKDITYHLFPHPVKDVIRFKRWLQACNNENVAKKPPMLVYKQYRICRRHFDSSSMNGGCRRLLKTAIPTLHLNLERACSDSEHDEDAIDLPMDTDPLAEHLIGDVEEDISDVGAQDIASFDTFEIKYDRLNTAAKSTPRRDILRLKEVSIQKPKHTDQYQTNTKNNKYSYLNEIHSKHKLRNLKTDISDVHEEYLIEEREERPIEAIMVTPKNDIDDLYELLDVEDSIYSRIPLSDDTLKQWRTEFYKCEKNILAQNVCSRVDPFDVCLSRKALETTQHVFTYKVESEGKPLTNQKNSGRCWLFAALNSIRIPFMKQYNLDEFEFSQAYLFYWDKIERCHYFLNNIIETALKGEEVTGRLVSFLLNDPTSDGGQWDMLVNLINKHGLMPKKCFPESYSCEASVRLNAVLKSKLREYTKVLRDLVGNSASEEDIKAKLNEQMGEIYRVVGICLGIPDEKFKWEYYDKSKSYQCVGPIRPIDFYEKYVKSVFNVDDKVCIVTDPRASSVYGQAYTVEYLGNVVGGRPVLYNNQPVELLMDLVTTSLKNSEPVWFGCEVSKRFAGKQGIEDLTIHDFKLVFGVDIQITMSKADRLLYGESAMTHAMTFTAVSCDDNGIATKFRVENSWGEDRGEKGYLIMSADWFKEFVFEVVVDKSIVPKEVLQVFEQNPIVLPAWDPMGTLANN